MQTFTLSVGESKTISANLTDASGAPGSFVAGTGSWLSDSGVATVTGLTDTTATVHAVSPGTANISLTIQTSTDGTPGANITFTLAQIVTGGPVANCTFSEA